MSVAKHRKNHKKKVKIWKEKKKHKLRTLQEKYRNIVKEELDKLKTQKEVENQ